MIPVVCVLGICGNLWLLLKATHPTSLPKDGRFIRKGQRVFVRQFWTDDRGAMVKNRHFTMLEPLPCYDDGGEISNEHFLQMVGDEAEDLPSRKEFNLQ